MYQRKLGDPTEVRNGHATMSSPVDTRNNGGSSPTTKFNKSTSSPRGKTQKQQLPHRMTPTRHNQSRKRYVLVTLSLVLLIGVWGFFGVWVSLEVTSRGDSHKLRNRIRFEMHRKDGNHNNVAQSFRLVSEGAADCFELDSPDAITVTLVTQVSHDRLWMMQHHCDRYRNKEGGPLAQHPMSIAVYSNVTLDNILEELRGINCGVADTTEADPPHTEPVQVSVLDARTHGAWNDYPVNELRNLALSKVQTTHILYIDVDFWPCEDLYETIMNDGRDEDPASTSASGDGETSEAPSKSIRQYLFEDPKLALVIPAFQLWRQCHEWEDCRDMNLPHMEASRDFEGFAREVLEHKSISIFDPTNKGGHSSTDYAHWFHQPRGTLHDIECLQSNRYEPFVMVRYCKDLPPFQTAFAGYGKNKVSWLMQMVASGYIFSQVGRAYLIHYPHLDSASRQMWNGGPDSPTTKNAESNRGKSITKRGKTDAIFVAFKQWLKDTIPADTQRLELCEDAQNDDHKLWVERPPEEHIKRNE